MTVEEGDIVEVYNRTAEVTDVYDESLRVIFDDGSPRKKPVSADDVTVLEGEQ